MQLYLLYFSIDIPKLFFFAGHTENALFSINLYFKQALSDNLASTLDCSAYEISTASDSCINYIFIHE